jgi:hypothetical protein
MPPSAAAGTGGPVGTDPLSVSIYESGVILICLIARWDFGRWDFGLVGFWSVGFCRWDFGGGILAGGILGISP